MVDAAHESRVEGAAQFSRAASRSDVSHTVARAGPQSAVRVNYASLSLHLACVHKTYVLFDHMRFLHSGDLCNLFRYGLASFYRFLPARTCASKDLRTMRFDSSLYAHVSCVRPVLALCSVVGMGVTVPDRTYAVQ